MKRYLIASLFAVLALLSAPLWAADSISVAQLKQDMQAGKGPIIIDVRDEDEYLAGHIPGAIMVPAKQMEHHLDMMEQYRKEQIVLYCQSGRRASAAATVLENAGMALLVRGHTVRDFEDEAKKWLARVGLEGNENQYPHQLSGGMQQRVGIARALASNSPVMLMDEAFSALDPLIRSDMQDLLLELQEELKKTVVFITHDLATVKAIADSIAVMYQGEVVRYGTKSQVLSPPFDDYTDLLLSSVPEMKIGWLEETIAHRKMESAGH